MLTSFMDGREAAPAPSMAYSRVGRALNRWLGP
jgi:hypothetical protein